MGGGRDEAGERVSAEMKRGRIVEGLRLSDSGDILHAARHLFKVAFDDTGAGPHDDKTILKYGNLSA